MRILDSQSRQLRRVLRDAIELQAVTHGRRCPATQETLTPSRAVLVKVHNKPQRLGKTWCVVDGYAFDCATEDGTMAELHREYGASLQVIDGRVL